MWSNDIVRNDAACRDGVCWVQQRPFGSTETGEDVLALGSSDPDRGALSDDRRIRLLVEAIRDYAIFMLDQHGIVVSWNAGARRFHGYEESEIVGEHFSRFYATEDQRAGLPARALATANRTGKFEGEGWRLRKDGARFWANVIIEPIRDPSGTLIGYAKIIRDLTERRLAEDRLQRSEEQFTRLVQGVTDYSIYLLEPDGRVATWNAGAERIKGYAPFEIIGEHFSRFYAEEDRQNNEPQRALEIARRDGRFEKEGWRVRKNGERFWANIVIDAIYDDTGEIIGYAKITRDITERRDTQIALEKAREALFMSQKMDAIGQLTGGVAHDFNNLLTAILGSLEIARKRVGDPSVTRLLDNAIHGAQRGASLTQRMLTFARRQDLDPKAVDIPALVRGMTELLERSLGPSVVIETRFPLGLASVTVDPNQLEMALLNLAVNARDAMPEGGRIIVAAQAKSVLGGEGKLNPGPYICLSVVDAGEGMDEATLAHAIEPFFTTKEPGKGTGLGLPMVQGLAEQSGGQFVLKSRKGLGTTAELWLPVAPKASGEAVAAAAAPRRASPEPAGQRLLVVLVVDDDALVLTNMAAMLEDIGHKVFEAKSAAEALALLRGEPTIELVITDYAMPRMTGMELIAAITAERPDLPTILATGYAELPPGSDPLQMKIAKPFRQHDLIRAVDRAMAELRCRSDPGLRQR
jgi:PAS domain S-box-containing protein